MQSWTGPLRQGLLRPGARSLTAASKANAGSATPTNVRQFSGQINSLGLTKNVQTGKSTLASLQGEVGAQWLHKSGFPFRQFSLSAVEFSTASGSDDPSKVNGGDSTNKGALDNEDPHVEQQEREHCFSSMRERDTMERLESQVHMSLDSVSASSMQASEMPSSYNQVDYGDQPSEQYNSSGGVSLSGVMQSNVPEPFQSSIRGTPTHMNMPGGGSTRGDKYLAGHIKDVHPSRQYSTSAAMSAKHESDNLYTPYSDMQGLQGPIEAPTVNVLAHLENPCPQGVQGEDCANFKLWLNNCIRFGLSDCNDNLAAFRAGRKSLPEIFAEQEKLIQEAALQYRKSSTPSQQVRGFSTSSRHSANNPEEEAVSSATNSQVKLSQKDRLKRAVKEYGATVVVFHVSISLMSLGTAYLAVSSGLDVVGLLEKIGVGKTILESRLATGTSTFVVAYAVHKVFAPVRIATTLTATPFIVHHLRRIGFLKPPKVKAS